MSLLHIGGSGSSVVAPEGVDFDGVSDYLSRSSDLVGNVDSKTFTFSAWVYSALNSNQFIFNSTNSAFRFYLENSTNVKILARNSANVVILSVTVNISFSSFTTGNLLISCDMANSANRSVYINDILQSTIWTTYTNDIINFTELNWYIGADNTTSKLKGRLSHLYLDYTYRDLSIEANRRLFITADGKPTPTGTLKALNPILYLPMKDNATAHINEGTGGNFTLNGTIATSERGANQGNCVASYFDGTADYLSRTSLIGIADGKQVTFSCNFKIKTLSDDRSLFTLINSAYTSSPFNVYINVNGLLFIQGYSSSGQNLYFLSPASSFIINREYTLTLSIDLSNTANRNVIVNGKALSGTWSIYTNSNFYYTKPTLGSYIGILYPPNTYLLNGDIGELYFDTKYIDLATNNPFWDKDTNKPKPVRQVIKETGVTPLIAMPLDASNAGKNYGTGGDFTANSAPYVGARGASEFWARSVKSGTSDASFVKSSSLGADARYCIVSSMFKMTTSSIIRFIASHTTASTYTYNLDISISGVNSGSVLSAYYADNGVTKYQLNQAYTTLTSLSLNTWYWFVFIYDSVNPSSSKWYIDGVQGTALTPSTAVAADSIKYSRMLYNTTCANSYDSAFSSTAVYTTDYIDFSQEVNRLKFVDAMGYPTNLKEKIDAGIIPKPLIYLPFDDTTNLGKNLGTGGDFTVNGTVTAGADVLG